MESPSADISWSHFKDTFVGGMADYSSPFVELPSLNLKADSKFLEFWIYLIIDCVFGNLLPWTINLVEDRLAGLVPNHTIVGSRK